MIKKIWLLFLLHSFAYAQEQAQYDIFSDYFTSAFVVSIDRSYLVYKDDIPSKKYIPICKGTVISPTQIVTSANCVDSSKQTYTQSYRNLTIYKNNTRYKINNIYKNNDFNKDTSSNNLSILELDGNILLSKYPSFATSLSLTSMIKNKTNMQLLFQNQFTATLQLAQAVSSSFCSSLLDSSLDKSVFCIKSSIKNIKIRVCPEFQGSPITRVKANGDIELVGILPKLSISSCADVFYVLAVNVSTLRGFLDKVNKKTYFAQGALSKGYIKTLPKGWHFLGTQESIDKDLLYILDYAKKIYYYVNETKTYKIWKKINGKWSDDLFIPARAGFWLQR